MNVTDYSENGLVLFQKENDLGCLIETKPIQPSNEGKEKKRPGWEYQPGRSG